MVLREPQHTLAAPHAGVFERVGEALDAIGQRRVGEPQPVADHGELLRAGATVLFEDLAERERMQGGHGCSHTRPSADTVPRRPSGNRRSVVARGPIAVTRSSPSIASTRHSLRS